MHSSKSFTGRLGHCLGAADYVRGQHSLEFWKYRLAGVSSVSSEWLSSGRELGVAEREWLSSATPSSLSNRRGMDQCCASEQWQ